MVSPIENSEAKNEIIPISTIKNQALRIAAQTAAGDSSYIARDSLDQIIDENPDIAKFNEGNKSFTAKVSLDESTNKAINSIIIKNCKKPEQELQEINRAQAVVQKQGILVKNRFTQAKIALDTNKLTEDVDISGLLQNIYNIKISEDDNTKWIYLMPLLVNLAAQYEKDSDTYNLILKAQEDPDLKIPAGTFINLTNTPLGSEKLLIATRAELLGIKETLIEHQQARATQKQRVTQANKYDERILDSDQLALLIDKKRKLSKAADDLEAQLEFLELQIAASMSISIAANFENIAVGGNKLQAVLAPFDRLVKKSKESSRENAELIKEIAYAKAELLQTVAQMFYKKGENAEALAAYQTALRLLGDNEVQLVSSAADKSKSLFTDPQKYTEYYVAEVPIIIAPSYADEDDEQREFRLKQRSIIYQEAAQVIQKDSVLISFRQRLGEAEASKKSDPYSMISSAPVSATLAYGKEENEKRYNAIFDKVDRLYTAAKLDLLDCKTILQKKAVAENEVAKESDGGSTIPPINVSFSKAVGDVSFQDDPLLKKIELANELLNDTDQGINLAIKRIAAKQNVALSQIAGLNDNKKTEGARLTKALEISLGLKPLLSISEEQAVIVGSPLNIAIVSGLSGEAEINIESRDILAMLVHFAGNSANKDLLDICEQILISCLKNSSLAPKLILEFEFLKTMVQGYRYANVKKKLDLAGSKLKQAQWLAIDLYRTSEDEKVKEHAKQMLGDATSIRLNIINKVIKDERKKRKDYVELLHEMRLMLEKDGLEKNILTAEQVVEVAMSEFKAYLTKGDEKKAMAMASYISENFAAVSFVAKAIADAEKQGAPKDEALLKQFKDPKKVAVFKTLLVEAQALDWKTNLILGTLGTVGLALTLGRAPFIKMIGKKMFFAAVGGVLVTNTYGAISGRDRIKLALNTGLNSVTYDELSVAGFGFLFEVISMGLPLCKAFRVTRYGRKLLRLNNRWLLSQGSELLTIGKKGISEAVKTKFVKSAVALNALIRPYLENTLKVVLKEGDDPFAYLLKLPEKIRNEIATQVLENEFAHTVVNYQSTAFTVATLLYLCGPNYAWPLLQMLVQEGTLKEKWAKFCEINVNFARVLAVVLPSMAVQRGLDFYYLRGADVRRIISKIHSKDIEITKGVEFASSPYRINEVDVKTAKNDNYSINISTKNGKNPGIKNKFNKALQAGEDAIQHCKAGIETATKYVKAFAQVFQDDCGRMFQKLLQDESQLTKDELFIIKGQCEALGIDLENAKKAFKEKDIGTNSAYMKLRQAILGKLAAQKKENAQGVKELSGDDLFATGFQCCYDEAAVMLPGFQTDVAKQAGISNARIETGTMDVNGVSQRHAVIAYEVEGKSQVLVLSETDPPTVKTRAEFISDNHAQFDTQPVVKVEQGVQVIQKTLALIKDGDSAKKGVPKKGVPKIKKKTESDIKHSHEASQLIDETEKNINSHLQKLRTCISSAVNSITGRDIANMTINQILDILKEFENHIANIKKRYSKINNIAEYFSNEQNLNDLADDFDQITNFKAIYTQIDSFIKYIKTFEQDNIHKPG
ncbi:MAG: hypothetical protein JW841_13675, partial [Deltaproteobacteria bacterium]|nr:hypothetical protein [Deltaproteobacteria bacterium]